MLENAKIIDLTKPMNKRLEIYRDDTYSDPDFHVETWCTVDTQGYWVSKLSLGTQTGTHIDAPSHFNSGAATLEELPPDALVGPYFHVDLDRLNLGDSLDQLLHGFSSQRILFLACPPVGISIQASQFMDLCALAVPVWVITDPIRIRGQHPLFFHETLAESGVYLIEDLDPQAARQVEPIGELIALPMRLEGVSGSPCRVLALIWS